MRRKQHRVLMTPLNEKVLLPDEGLREKKLESLCGESKRVFYATVSRIKKRFIKVLGATRARSYYIARGNHGMYRTKAKKCG